MIRTMIVDDEAPARRKIPRLLAKHAEFAVVAEAASGSEAVEKINVHLPELLFLDISLPDRSAFQVLEEISYRAHMRTVFVTAHDHYAVKAYEVQALDYLLKPVEPSRFVQTLDRIKDAIAMASTNSSATAASCPKPSYL